MQLLIILEEISLQQKMERFVSHKTLLKLTAGLCLPIQCELCSQKQNLHIFAINFCAGVLNLACFIVLRP